MKILILNGPNLNLLGRRQPEIYGSATMDDTFAALRRAYPGVELELRQSNSEGVLVDIIQEYGFDAAVAGIVLNAGGYTHTSVAVADAVAAVEVPVVEVHISNPQARGEMRRRSLLAGVCAGTIAGFGRESYRLAVDYLVNLNGAR